MCLLIEVSLKAAYMYFPFFLYTMGPHKCQLQFEKRPHVGRTYTSLLLTTSGIIKFDALRQP